MKADVCGNYNSLNCIVGIMSQKTVIHEKATLHFLHILIALKRCFAQCNSVNFLCGKLAVAVGRV